MRIAIGTRGSQLAMWQANRVKELLETNDISCGIETIATQGDLVQDVPLNKLGVVGVFTKAIDEALLNNEIDIAVHSAKDMPAQLHEGLEVIAYLEREDPRDVLLATRPDVSLENMSKPLVIGTSSVRRRALLKHYVPYVTCEGIRGNIDTRIQKLQGGDYDAIMLAYAGVKRLKMDKYVVQKLNTSTFTPSAGQGAIAIVAATGRLKNEAQVRKALNHVPTEQALLCERAYLQTIAGGCSTPVFGLASLTANTLSFSAGIAEEDTGVLWREQMDGKVDEASEIGKRIGQKILEASTKTA